MEEHDSLEEPADPLTVGDLITLQEAAEYGGFERNTLHNYIKRGRLRALKRGWMWFTTRAAVDQYLASRQQENIPRKYRR
jgi:excisionase family DNA binding protein